MLTKTKYVLKLLRVLEPLLANQLLDLLFTELLPSLLTFTFEFVLCISLTHFNI